MKHLKFPLIAIFLLSFIAGCQKELSFEQPLLNSAEGSLKSSTSGDCLPIIVKGTYKAGVNVGDTNYVDIEVDVTKVGSYTIASNPVNGYSFNGAGDFTILGATTVRLKAVGKPTVAGNDDFNITFDSTTCFFSIDVIAGTPPPPPGGPAAFILAGMPGICGSFVPSGNYVLNTALTTSNTVTVGVNVTTAGSYTISTNPVNGMQFSATGVFATTGNQTVVLNGSGTPAAAIASNFTVTAGTSTCTFTITVTGTPPPPPVTNNDYFPLTANSWWSYDSPSSPGDSIKRVNNATASNNGNIYRVFEEFDAGGTSQWEYYYRKSGNDYLEYLEVHNYSILTFDGTVEGDILFLKEGLTTGATWMSAEYTGTVNTISTKLRYSFTCTDANATVTVNGKTFNNVYKITWKPQVSIMGTSYADEVLTWNSYYAKGIGLIYTKVTDGVNTEEVNIRNWKIF